MDIAPSQGCNSGSQSEEESMGTKRGPWSIEEDLILVDYIAKNGEGHWNSLARCAGLKRTGKSCRLRWLNYLRPDVRRGNITLEEQLLILELHSRWGNRWSKIAQYLPGRTDNEIKNYWRTRVQKQAKQLKCDVNSKQFKDTMQYVWMPRLLERIQASSWGSSSNSNNSNKNEVGNPVNFRDWQTLPQVYDLGGDRVYPNFTPEHSGSVDTAQVVSPAISDMDCYSLQGNNNNNHIQAALTSSDGYLDFSVAQQEGWSGGNVLQNNGWSMDDLWLLEQQLCGDI